MTTTTTKKVTKAQRFEDIKALLSNQPTKHDTDTQTAIDFINYELSLLAKKNSAPKKLNQTQKDNEVHKETILAYLVTCTEGKTCTEIQKEVPEMGDFSNQKVARLMSDLLKSGKVNKEIVKGRALFSIA